MIHLNQTLSANVRDEDSSKYTGHNTSTCHDSKTELPQSEDKSNASSPIGSKREKRKINYSLEKTSLRLVFWREWNNRQSSSLFNRGTIHSSAMNLYAANAFSVMQQVKFFGLSIYSHPIDVSYLLLDKMDNVISTRGHNKVCCCCCCCCCFVLASCP